MIDKPLDEIAAADLQRLIDNAVSEGTRLEYKEQLPGNSSEDRREFLADVSSLANSAGGDLVFGVAEQRDSGKPTGLPASVAGVAGPLDVLRLENMLRDGIAPRIAGIRFREVPGFDRGSVLVVRVPRSSQRPHMVTFQQLSRFYARNAQGKYVLDVGEIREAFMGAATATQQVGAFVRDRIASVAAGEIDFRLDSGRVVLVHVIPLAAFESGQPVDLHALLEHHGVIAPLYADSYDRRFNLDGFSTLSYAGSDKQVYSYLQVFRNGAIEGGTTGLFYEPQPGRAVGLGLASRAVAETVVDFVGRSYQILAILDIEGRIMLSMTLVGVRGVLLAIDERAFRSPLRPFSRDVMILPDVVVDDRSTSPESAVRPLLDALWQAAGLSRCSGYDEVGNWKWG